MGSSLMFLAFGDALAARWASSGSMAPEDAMKKPFKAHIIIKDNIEKSETLTEKSCFLSFFCLSHCCYN